MDEIRLYLAIVIWDIYKSSWILKNRDIKYMHDSQFSKKKKRKKNTCMTAVGWRHLPITTNLLTPLLSPQVPASTPVLSLTITCNNSDFRTQKTTDLGAPSIGNTSYITFHFLHNFIGQHYKSNFLKLFSI